MVDDDNILDSYPDEVVNFPCIIYTDVGQNDREFADNLPMATAFNIQIDIFTKAIENYPTATEIGLVVAEVMKDNYFALSSTNDVPDVVDNIRHRVMNFKKDILS